MRHAVVIATSCLLTVGVLSTSSATADDVALRLTPGAAASARPHASSAKPASREPKEAVTLGATGTPIECQPELTTWAQESVGAGTPSYTVPAAGVVTSVSTNANATAGSIRPVFLGPANPTSRAVVALGPLLTLTPTVLNTFPVRIPVPADSSLSMFISAINVSCGRPGVAGDLLSGQIVDPATTSTYTPQQTFATRALNISAVWEPDADRDGFGDVSQEKGTKVTRKPHKKTTQRLVSITFRSTIKGSTFTCKVDRKAAKRCRSPFRQTFSYGRHKVVITAISPLGTVDRTPVTVRFSVVKRH